MNLSIFRRVGIVCATSFALGAAGISFGQNLLTNPSFETPQLGTGAEAAGAGTGWMTYNAVYTENTGPGGTSFSPPLPAHDGDQVIKTFGGNSGFYQIIPVTQGENFSASAWGISWSGDLPNFSAGQSGYGQLLIIYHDSNGNQIGSTLANTMINETAGPITNDVWMDGTLSGTVPAGVTDIVFQLNTAMTGAGSIFYDDASLTVSPAPEPASIGMLALGGLAVLRRKR